MHKYSLICIPIRAYAKSGEKARAFQKNKKEWNQRSRMFLIMSSTVARTFGFFARFFSTCCIA